MDPNSLLHIEHLYKAYGKKVVLEDLSLTIRDQQALAIMGPSGSGKTTLLRIIAGLTLPDEGTIYLHGQPVNKGRLHVPPYQRRIGFVFQTAALWPHMTVEENIRFGLFALSKEESSERAFELMASLRIEKLCHRFPSELSGGEAQRVSIARALAPRPACILMDEPLTHLDQTLKGTLLDLIKERVLQQGIALLYVTHDEKEAKELTDDFFFFTDGAQSA